MQFRITSSNELHVHVHCRKLKDIATEWDYVHVTDSHTLKVSLCVNFCEEAFFLPTVTHCLTLLHNTAEFYLHSNSCCLLPFLNEVTGLLKLTIFCLMLFAPERLFCRLHVAVALFVSKYTFTSNIIFCRFMALLVLTVSFEIESVFTSWVDKADTDFTHWFPIHSI